MTRYACYGGKIWMHILPNKPVTIRPIETRIGSGKYHRTLIAEASDTGPVSGALLLSVTLLSEASERPTGSRRTRARYCFSVRCSMMSAGAQARFKLCALDAEVRPMQHRRTCPMRP